MACFLSWLQWSLLAFSIYSSQVCNRICRSGAGLHKRHRHHHHKTDRIVERVHAVIFGCEKMLKLTLVKYWGLCVYSGGRAHEFTCEHPPSPSLHYSTHASSYCPILPSKYFGLVFCFLFWKMWQALAIIITLLIFPKACLLLPPHTSGLRLVSGTNLSYEHAERQPHCPSWNTCHLSKCICFADCHRVHLHIFPLR